jgi:O-antigen ligase
MMAGIGRGLAANQDSTLIRNQHNSVILFWAVIVAVFGAIIVGSLIASAEAPWVSFIPLIILAGVVGLWVLARACQGNRAAILVYFALLAFMTDALLRPRGAGETSADWESVLKFGIWLGAGAIGWAHMPPLRTLINRPGPMLLLIYVIVCLFSAFYAPSPTYSFGSAIAVAALFAFAFALSSRLRIDQLLWSLVLSQVVFLCIGWVVFYVNPELGASPFATVNGMVDRFCGIAGQADVMGGVCAKYIGAIFLLWRAGRCKLLYALPLTALGIVSLLASDARTGMIAMAAGMAAVVLLRSRWGTGLFLLLGLAVFLLFQIAPPRLDGLMSGFSRSGDPSELSTLTGRLEIWEFSIKKILESPVIGWGYNSSKVVLGQHLGFENGLMIDTAHNLWLQNMLSVGLLGTLPLVALFVILIVKACRHPMPFRDFYMVVALVGGLADNQAFGTTPTLLMAVFFTAVVWPDRPARPRAAIQRSVVEPDSTGIPPDDRATPLAEYAWDSVGQTHDLHPLYHGEDHAQWAPK